MKRERSNEREREGKNLARRLGVNKSPPFDSETRRSGSLYTNDPLVKRERRAKKEHSSDDDDDDEDNGGNSSGDNSSNSDGDSEDVAQGREDGDHNDDNEIWKNEVAVNVNQMYSVDFLCKTDPIVKAGVELLINNLRSGGLSVTMDLFGAKIKLSRDHQKVFDIEWAGIFIKDLVWSLLTFGFAVVNEIPSNVKRGQYIPMVIQHTCYMLTFVDSFHKGREYRVYPMAQGAGYDIYRETGGKGVGSKARSDRNVGVYVLYPPHPITGELTSPLSTIYERLLTLNYTWENYARADFWNANPMWGVQTIQQQRTNADPNETVDIGENSLGIYLEKQKARVEENERADIRTAVDAAQQLHQGVTTDLSATSSYGRYGQNPSAHVAPYRFSWWPGHNRQIVAPPRPSYNTLFRDITETVIATVANVLNIPPQFLASDPTQHAANAELNLRLFDQAIKARQHDIEPILQDLFEKSYHLSHQHFRNDIYNEIKSSEEEQVLEHNMTKSQLEGHSIDKFIRSTGQPSQSGLETRGEVSKSDQIKVSKIMGSDFTTGSNGRQKRSKFGFSKPTASLSDAKLKELIANNVQFRIAFRRTPLTDLSSLQHAYDQDIIGYDEYAEDIGAVIGVDENHILTEEEHYNQKEKKAKLQSELAEKYSPDDNEGAGGKDKSKPKKKPTAESSGGGSSSSSNKSPGAETKAASPAAQKSSDSGAKLKASPTSVSSNLRKSNRKPPK